MPNELLFMTGTNREKIIKRVLISMGICFYFVCVGLYPFVILFFIHGLLPLLHVNDKLMVYADRIELNEKCLRYKKTKELQISFSPNMLLQRNYYLYCFQKDKSSSKEKRKSLNVSYIENIENIWVDIIHRDAFISRNEESDDKAIIRKLLTMRLNDENFIPVYAWTKMHVGRGSYYLDKLRYNEYAMALKEDKLYIIKLGRSYGKNPSRIFYTNERIIDRKEAKFYQLKSVGGESYVMGNNMIDLYNIDADMHCAVGRSRRIHCISQREEVEALREWLEYCATHIHPEKNTPKKSKRYEKRGNKEH